MANYDVIVIGGGHNGLTAATILAKAGRHVLVLEKGEQIGGIAASEEFHPGYRTVGLLHDTSCVRTSIVEKLKLRDYGLRTSGERPPVTLLSDDGNVITLSSDIEQSSSAIAAISRKDAQTYRDYKAFIESTAGWLRKHLDKPQPDLAGSSFSDLRHLLGAGVGLRRLGKETMLELLKVAPMCVADFLNEMFETEFLKAGLALPAILGSFNGPWSSYTTLNLLLWECTAREHLVGGPAELVAALEQAAEANGALIRKNAEVDRIELDNSGKATGVRLQDGEQIYAKYIAASCTPKETFLRLLKSNEIGPNLESQITHLKCRGTTAKINLALNQRVQWKAKTDMPIEFARTGNSLYEIEQAFDAVKYRKFSEKPILDIFLPTVSNNHLAPQGHEVVSILAQFVPYDYETAWTDAAKAQLRQSVIEQFEKHTNGLAESIVAYEVLTPFDLESRYGLTGGHPFHAEHAVHQLIGRPVPSCVGYKTPIRGLFLCGSGSHPGGGLTCVPGLLAAETILQLRIN